MFRTLFVQHYFNHVFMICFPLVIISWLRERNNPVSYKRIKSSFDCQCTVYCRQNKVFFFYLYNLILEYCIEIISTFSHFLSYFKNFFFYSLVCYVQRILSQLVEPLQIVMSLLKSNSAQQKVITFHQFLLQKLHSRKLEMCKLSMFTFSFQYLPRKYSKVTDEIKTQRQAIHSARHFPYFYYNCNVQCSQGKMPLFKGQLLYLL